MDYFKLKQGKVDRIIRAYVQQKPDLPFFEPPSGSDNKIAEHIAGMKLPMTMDNSPLPSLLLHRLRDARHCPGRTERLKKLFSTRPAK